MASWPSTVDAQERARRVIDLFLVSVLLDAGAGTQWQYKSKESGRVYRRSEGLAVASLEMFKAGAFSSDPSNPHQVDSGGLKRLDTNIMAKGLQVTETNPIDGLEGRTGVLVRLGGALQTQEIFGVEARPGNMLGKLSVPLRFVLTLIKFRLSTISSINSSIICPSSFYPDLVVRLDGWPWVHLAIFENSDRRNSPW